MQVLLTLRYRRNKNLISVFIRNQLAVPPYVTADAELSDQAAKSSVSVADWNPRTFYVPRAATGDSRTLNLRCALMIRWSLPTDSACRHNDQRRVDTAYIQCVSFFKITTAVLSADAVDYDYKLRNILISFGVFFNLHISRVNLIRMVYNYFIVSCGHKSSLINVQFV